MTVGKGKVELEKLRVEFENHSKHDFETFAEIKTYLQKIDSKLDIGNTTNNETIKKLAVLETEYKNHMENHSSYSRNAAVVVAIISISIQGVSFLIQHVLK